MKDFQEPVLFETYTPFFSFLFKPLLVINVFSITEVSKVMKVTSTITKDKCD